MIGAVPYLVKVEANKAVRAAARARVLARPPACQRCGAVSRGDRATALDGHHADYTKPLDVAWLCKPCHRRAHVLIHYAAKARAGGSPLFQWMIDADACPKSLAARAGVSVGAVMWALRGARVPLDVAAKVLVVTRVALPSRGARDPRRSVGGVVSLAKSGVAS